MAPFEGVPGRGRSGRRSLRPHLDPAAAAPDLLEAAPVEGGDADHRRGFDRAAAEPPDLGARGAAAAVLRDLARAPVAGIGRIPYASNAVFLLELEGRDPHRPAEPLRAVYKPVRGERPLWDFPNRTLHLREVASHLVDAALGLQLVPPTVLRDGPLGPGSCQLFIAQPRDGLRGAQPQAIDSQLRALAALDVLINNADRKRAHLLVAPPHRLQGIDNALTFLPYPRQRTFLLELGGSPLPRAVARRLQRLAADSVQRSELRRRLGLLLSSLEVEAFEHRLDELAADPFYPELDPWDGRPFEWF